MIPTLLVIRVNQMVDFIIFKILTKNFFLYLKKIVKNIQIIKTFKRFWDKKLFFLLKLVFFKITNIITN
jgi:hypothetical protein